MMDTFTLRERSEVMRRIKSKDTSPEVSIRKYLHNLGFRYRLHVKNMPGKPDIVLKKHNAVILYNGCFWHGHENCKYSHLPKSNKNYWRKKIYNNMLRDKKNTKLLREAGWRLLIVWECSHRGKSSKVLDSVCLQIHNWLVSESDFDEIRREE